MATAANGRQVRCLPIGDGEYAVQTRAGKGARWTCAGRVARFLSPGVAVAPDWAALGVGASAWTPYRRTRSAAVADMLAGVTYRTYANA